MMALWCFYSAHKEQETEGKTKSSEYEFLHESNETQSPIILLLAVPRSFYLDSTKTQRGSQTGISHRERVENTDVKATLENLKRKTELKANIKVN